MFNQEPLIKKAKSSPIYSTKNVTYNQLMRLIENDQLNPGSSYRITDYEMIIDTTQALLFRSAGHSFDLIVTALTENTLYDFAKATQREGDTYFASVNMGSWVIKYSPYNDPDKSPIASNTGKGVIYYMKDEWENECPYDFKNLQIYHVANAQWYYTFNSATDTDFSNTNTPVCSGNKIQYSYQVTQFTNIFTELSISCQNNILIDCSSLLILGELPNSNVFRKCSTSTFEDMLYSDLQNVHLTTISGADGVTLKGVWSSNLTTLFRAVMNNCTQITSGTGGSYQMYNCSNIILGEDCNSFFTNCSLVSIPTNNCKLNSFFGVKSVILDDEELFGKEYSHIITQGQSGKAMVQWYDGSDAIHTILLPV